MIRQIRNLFLVVILCGSLFTFPALAETTTFKLNPYVPHLYFNGYGGDGTANAIGRADILAPLYTNYNKNLFLYGQGWYVGEESNQQKDLWEGSFGLGFRQMAGGSSNSKLFNTPRIYGVYLLSDYSTTPDGNNFWMLSPGIETLGERVDFRANGYFPVGTKKWVQTYEIYQNHLTENDLYGICNDGESVGPGADAEIGLKVFSIKHMPVKFFLNGYYFAPEDQDDVLGVGGRITFQPTRYLTLELKDSYDNDHHNIVMAGARFYLNGLINYRKNGTNVDTQGVQPRLYDQIERNLAVAGTGTNGMTVDHINFMGTKPSEYNAVYVKNDSIEQSILAASAGDISGDGTLENPYLYTGPTDMQTILDNTFSKYGSTPIRIYFTSPSGTPFLMPTNPTYITPYSNQMLWGTTGENWDIPTTPNTYAVDFMGAFAMSGISNVEFHYLQADNYSDTDAFTMGMSIVNSQNILLQSVQVGEFSETEAPISGAYLNGIAMENGASIILNDAVVYGYGGGYDGNGITVTDGGSITASNNTIVEGDNAGINLLPNIISGNASMGNISGDGTVQYLGLESGFSAIVSGDILIGNITGSEFSGGNDGILIAGGYDEYSQPTAATSITIGDITNTSFTGTGNNGAVFFATGITIGNISGTGSSFSGRYDGILIAGGHDDTIYHYPTPATSITIGDITNASFTGTNEDNGTYGAEFYATGITIGNTTGITSSSFFGDEDGIFIAGGYDLHEETAATSITIGDITNTSFTGTHNNGAEFYANTISIGSIVNINGTSSSFSGAWDGIFIAGGYDSNYKPAAATSITIGDITNTSFTGTHNNGAEFYANTILIGSIGNLSGTGTSSSFSGDYDGIFIAGGHDNTIYHHPTAATSITIGDITNTSFTGTSNIGAEFYAMGITIGSISGTGTSSSFSGGGAGIFIAGGDNQYGPTQATSITIGDITDTSFIAYAGIILYGNSDSITVNSQTPINNGEDLYNAIVNGGNTFSNYYTDVNGSPYL